MSIHLPTREQALQYFEDYFVPDNIKAHCVKVCDLALFLGKELTLNGVKVNLAMVECLALFHDLCKMVTITKYGSGEHKGSHITLEQQEFWKSMKLKYQGMYEGEVASSILKEQYPELAVGLLHVSDPWHEAKTIEELLVYYADLRILKDSVVTLLQRIEYLKKVYPRENTTWQKFSIHCHTQEKRIFDKIGFTPEDLGAKFEVKLYGR
jgi:hypothetical protein